MRRRERDGILMNSRLFCYFITSKGSKWAHGHEKRVYFYVSQCCSFGMSCLSLVVMRNCRSWELVFVQASVADSGVQCCHRWFPFLCFWMTSPNTLNCNEWVVWYLFKRYLVWVSVSMSVCVIRYVMNSHYVCQNICFGVLPCMSCQLQTQWPPPCAVRFVGQTFSGMTRLPFNRKEMVLGTASPHGTVLTEERWRLACQFIFFMWNRSHLK